ncbi:MAG: DHA2 family efflux MFS transporter permease subunit [Chloroflexi bacterium]|nr:DHA2 family efflux MFS transporter permease subunit [Chloroflexota bacterium]
MAALGGQASRLKQRARALDYQWQALSVVIVGSFMVMLDTTIVNIALPRITVVFGASVDRSQLILTGYMLALAVVMPAAGYLTDTFGTKRVYLAVMGLFTLGSALCGVSWDVNSLVFFRVIQGLGGGMLMPLGMTIIYKTVPPQQRGTVMGVFGLPLILAPVLGPTLGGYLVEYVDWRVIFTLNIPVGLLGLLLGATLLQETETRPGLRFDIPGFLLSAVGFGSLLLGLSRGAADGWTSPMIVAYLFAGIAALLIWAIVELDAEVPLLELRVLKDTTYSLATAVTFISTMAMFSSMFLLPLFLQNLRGLGALESGLLTFPQAVASGVMMPISGRLFNRVGPRPLVVSGLIVMAYSTWRLAALNLATSDDELRLMLILRGAGMGLLMMPAMTAAMNTVPPHLVARASSLTNVLRQLFGSFGTAIFATLLQTRTNFHSGMLAQTVTPDSFAVQNAMAGIQQALIHQGLPLAQAKAGALMALGQLVAMGAAVRAYDDAFLVAAILSLLGVVPALFLTSTGVRTLQRTARPGEKTDGESELGIAMETS